MTNRKALVTGATGFIGSHLVRHLLRAKWQVHAIVRPESDHSALAGESSLKVHEHTGSMESMLSILTDTQPDVVFHLASLFLSKHQSVDIDRLVGSNILFGAQLVEAMTQVGVKALVNTGTAWQHYQGQQYNPVNLYAATKQAFEALLDYYTEANGLRSITLKLHDTYGPSDPRPKLVNLLVRVAESNESLAMSPGEQQISLVHIDDIVSAFEIAAERLLERPEIKREDFSLESAQKYTLKQLVSEFERLVGRRLPISWGDRPYREREIMVPWTGKKLPHWQQRVDLRSGLRNLLQESKSSEVER